MTEPSPTTAARAEPEQRVLCVAARAAEAVARFGGTLALHAARGDAVEVALLVEADVQAARAALEPLGVERVRALGLAPGALGAEDHLVARLEALLADADPALVLTHSPLDGDADHAAAGWALLAAAAHGPERTLLVDATGSASSPQFEVDVAAVEPRVVQARERSGASAAPRPGPVERFVALPSREAWRVRRSGDEVAARLRGTGAQPWAALPRTSAVVSTWNKRADLRANLQALRAQTLPFAEVIVVDNASRDGTAEMVATEFPEVRLIVMPHDRYGACETFNVGFASVTSPLTAILDDDIVMPPDWLEKATRRLAAEPPTTAVLSTQVIEPGMPESYRTSAAVNTERYMSTFRGCASLARTAALAAAGGYDERLFIYGNERDLTCRLLNLGYRVLQHPGCHVFHKTPFGIKMGKRSLYYHARNAWLSMLKYAPLPDLLRMPWLVVTKVLLRGAQREAEGAVTDAVGTIGIGRSVRETPGAWRVLAKAALSVLWNVPYCLRRRAPCRAPDFELPIH